MSRSSKGKSWEGELGFESDGCQTVGAKEGQPGGTSKAKDECDEHSAVDSDWLGEGIFWSRSGAGVEGGIRAEEQR